MSTFSCNFPTLNFYDLNFHDGFSLRQYLNVSDRANTAACYLCRCLSHSENLPKTTMRQSNEMPH